MKAKLKAGLFLLLFATKEVRNIGCLYITTVFSLVCRILSNKTVNE
jgi:hypothetical protein